MISFRCSFSFLFPVPFAFCVYPPHLSAGRDETISAACKRQKEKSRILHSHSDIKKKPKPSSMQEGFGFSAGGKRLSKTIQEGANYLHKFRVHCPIEKGILVRRAEFGRLHNMIHFRKVHDLVS